MIFARVQIISIFLALFCCLRLRAAQTFRIATYNVENYLDQDSGTRHAKSEAAKVLKSPPLDLHPF
jgi:hypothetical protein